MNCLEERNQKIMNAVIEKADRVCPGSLALIGIYGSFATGDFYEKSDLDLLILINDDQGWKLGCTFIQEDLGVGHDIYCTTWESLQADALYNHPNISKLMDSEIVYCTDDKYMEELLLLRKKVKDILSAPFSGEDYEKAERMLKEAEHCYMQALTADTMTNLWVQTGYTVFHVENAIAMLNKKYFRYGSKRIYDELEAMERRPDNLCELIQNVISGGSADQVKLALSSLVCETAGAFKKAKKTIMVDKNPVTAASIRGTYEEMFSNWRNKMYAAAEMGSRHLAFMSMISLNSMLADISESIEIADYDVFQGYDPKNLQGAALKFDEILEAYLAEYEKAGLQVMEYQDIDAFVKGYLGEE